MARFLVTILYSANLDMTNLCTDEMVFFHNLMKIDNDENKQFSVYAWGLMLCLNEKNESRRKR